MKQLILLSSLVVMLVGSFGLNNAQAAYYDDPIYQIWGSMPMNGTAGTAGSAGTHGTSSAGTAGSSSSSNSIYIDNPNYYNYPNTYYDDTGAREVGYHSDSLENSNRDEPDDANEVIYSDYSHTPIVNTNGRALTLGEFNNAYGAINTSCTANGMVVNGHMGGLVPGGTYSLWPSDFNYRAYVSEPYGVNTDLSGINHGFQANNSGVSDFSTFIPNGHAFLQGHTCTDAGDLGFSGMYQPPMPLYAGQEDYIEHFEFET